MEFDIRTPRLSYVQTYFTAAAEAMRSMLTSTYTFDAKLNVLTVQVDEDRSHPSCFHLTDDHNGCVIELHVDMLTLDTDVLLIASHELAHMLMNHMDVGSYMTLADGSRLCCSIVHRCDKDGNDFGLGLEEALAELIALEVTRRAGAKLDIPRRSLNFAIRQQEASSKPLILAAAAFARCFGKPLARLSHLDEKEPFGKQVVFFNPNGDDVTISSAADSIRNMFWYFLSNGSFPEIACRYDKLMGTGAYTELCRKFDALYLDLCDRVTYSAEERLLMSLLALHEDSAQRRMHEEIMTLVGQFSQRLNASEKRFSTVPAANNSLREVIRHMRRRLKAAATHPVENGDGCPSPLREELVAMGKQLSLASPMQSLLRASLHFDRIDAAYSVDGAPYAVHMTALRDMLRCAVEVIEYYKPKLVAQIRSAA